MNRPPLTWCKRQGAHCQHGGRAGVDVGDRGAELDSFSLSRNRREVGEGVPVAVFVQPEPVEPVAERLSRDIHGRGQRERGVDLYA